ncbi:peptidoglycan bridge formation glycyltransferase FemA/FemB family protein [Candidatus Kuenenbacteria bacterium]|nr:peptidoglycan bridge formation glycyltransferase FemA/FemB family protein [Candidatus Kuenenbacteria bacterium]
MFKKIIDKKIYNNFIENHSCGNALQSWEWGELKEKFGWQTERFGFFEKDKLIGAVQFLSHTFPKYSVVCCENKWALFKFFPWSLIFCRKVRDLFKKFPSGFKILYIPRGPVLDFKNENNLKYFLLEIKKIAKEKKADLIRIEPNVINELRIMNYELRNKLNQEENRSKINENFIIQNLKQNGFQKSKISYQPSDTMVVDLKKTEQEIWQKELNKDARYNIRLAERKGVKIREGENEKDVKEFYKLWQKTQLRQKISIRSEEYYKKLFSIFPKENVHLFLAQYQEKNIAGLILLTFGKKAIYLYAASDYNFHALAPTYFIVWKAILKAKEKGCEIFDFWGVAPEGAKKNHPWQGITTFKQKFCQAKRINYIGAWDFPMSWKYWIFIWLEKIKK